MNKKIIGIVLAVIFCLIFCFIFNKNNNEISDKDENDEINSMIDINDNSNIENSNTIVEELKDNEADQVEEIYIKVNNNVLAVKLEDNDSTKALIRKLRESDIAIDAREYGDFEKVGDLGFSLPQNDKNIKTEVGDIMLYQGNQVTVFYGSNSWSYTRIGKIQNVSQDELKNILGNGNVKLTFSFNK